MDEDGVGENFLSSGATRRQVVQRIPEIAAAIAAASVSIDTAAGQEVETKEVNTAHSEPPAIRRSERTLTKPSFDFEEVDSTAWDIHQCNYTLERFSGKNSAFKRVSEDLGFSRSKAQMQNTLQHLNKSMIGHNEPVKDRKEARAGLAFMIGAAAWNNISEPFGDGLENRGLLSWSPLFVPEWLSKNPEPNPDPGDLTEKIKSMARFYGAGRAGVTKFNRKWILSETCREQTDPDPNAETKPIIFRDVDQPLETRDELVIPEKVRFAVVVVLPTARPGTQTGPANVLGSGSQAHAYGRHGLTEIALAEAIRAMGYVAIPCKNSTALSVPLAIDAGLGQLGRHGYLVTPWWGSHVRLGKVLTDMPLVADKPIDFGVTDYCTKCGICAAECPAGAISRATERTFEPPKSTGPTGNAGALKWYVDGKRCLMWWIESGAGCSQCMNVCPYTDFSMTDFWQGSDPDPNNFWDLELPMLGVEDKRLGEA